MDERVEAVIDVILENAATGEIDDGKVFTFKAEDAVRIRNHERGELAL